MKDFAVGFLLTGAGVAMGVYGVIWKANCAGRACLFAVPDWLPMF